MLPGEPGLRCPGCVAAERVSGAAGRFLLTLKCFLPTLNRGGFKVLLEGNSEEAAGNIPLHHSGLSQQLLGFIPLMFLITTPF